MYSRLFVLLCMIAAHILDDFVLQNTLAKMKQKGWWRQQEGYSEKYANDWIPALLAHAFGWTFAIMFPIAFSCGERLLGLWFYLTFVTNFAIHAFIDHMKANEKTINLCVDQSIHLIQIIVSFCIYYQAMRFLT